MPAKGGNILEKLLLSSVVELTALRVRLPRTKAKLSRAIPVYLLKLPKVPAL
jgi:hypothetical protein